MDILDLISQGTVPQDASDVTALLGSIANDVRKNTAPYAGGTPKATPESAAPKFDIQGILSAMQARDQKVNQMRGQRDFVESLMNVEAPVYAYTKHGVIGPREQQPYVAEGIRDRIGDLEDSISPAEAPFYKQMLGADLPPGIRRSQMKEIFPMISQQASLEAQRLRGQRQDLQHQEQMGLARERMAQQDRQFGLGEERRTGGLLGPMARELTSSKRAIGGLQEAMAKLGDPSTAGPVVQRWNELKKLIGTDEPRTSEAKAAAATALAVFVKDQSGAQVSNQEIGRWESIVGNANLRPETLQALLGSLLQDAKSNYSMTIERVRMTPGLGDDYLGGQGAGWLDPKFYTSEDEAVAQRMKFFADRGGQPAAGPPPVPGPPQVQPRAAVPSGPPVQPAPGALPGRPAPRGGGFGRMPSWPMVAGVNINRHMPSMGIGDPGAVIPPQEDEVITLRSPDGNEAQIKVSDLIEMHMQGKTMPAGTKRVYGK